MSASNNFAAKGCSIIVAKQLRLNEMTASGAIPIAFGRISSGRESISANHCQF